MTTASVERIKRKLADRIAHVRGDRSQRQFARDLGVFQQNVNRYESGTTPHTDFLITLAVTRERVDGLAAARQGQDEAGRPALARAARPRGSNLQRARREG